MGGLHAQYLTTYDVPIEVAAVADVDPAAARGVADAHGFTVCGSTAELLAREDIDAVIVATPSGVHADATIEALEAGKHVFLEKPIEVTLAEADRIIEAEQRSGMLLTVASPRRFSPHHQYLKELIDSGQLGRVCAATVEVPFWRTQGYYDSAGWRGTWRFDGGGALMNQAVHMVDLALWLLGDAEEVYAHTGLLAHEHVEVEDTATITARLRSGTLLTFMATTAAYDELPIRMTVMGDHGSVITEDQKIIDLRSSAGLRLPDLVNRSTPEQATAQVVEFARAVRGEAEPLTTSAQARAALAFIEAAYRSARTNSPVTVSQPSTAAVAQ